ncbi:hypothetical protein ACJA3G_35990, partial [Streptomyces sp. YS-3]
MTLIDRRPSRRPARRPALRLGLAVAASGALLLTGATPADAAHAPGPDRTGEETAPRGETWSDADVLGFWTAGRIASATDPGRPGRDGGRGPGRSGRAAVAAGA